MHDFETAIKVSDADIKKFRRLWLEKFGTEIDKNEARGKLLLLVRQVEIIDRKIDGDGFK